MNPAWRSGLYSARISDPDGDSFDITFIVKNAGLPAPATMAVLASTNTWHAYNDWGGASLYRGDPSDGLARQHAFVVHSQRPNPAASPRGHLVYQALETFMGRGGNLIYLSGNGLYWKAAPSKNRMEVRSDHTCHALINDTGGRWRDFGRPEWRMLGTRFTTAGYRSHYRPYKVMSPQHWIFEHTGVVANDLIGAARLNCGGVFSAGSITFGGSLAVDPVLSRMLLNVISRFSMAARANEGKPLRQQVPQAAAKADIRP